MNDTQWPRFEVFQQDRPDRPHRSAGSVHAPDGEMALLNARDVFVRRPSCYSLWVVPAEAIFSVTADQLEENPDLLSQSAASNSNNESYQIFHKQSQRNSMTYVTHAGKVEADNRFEAMRLAIDTTGDKATFVWWVVAEKDIIKSKEQDVSSHYAPAGDKQYRMPQDYRVLTEMLEYRSAEEHQEVNRHE